MSTLSKKHCPPSQLIKQHRLIWRTKGTVATIVDTLGDTLADARVSTVQVNQLSKSPAATASE